MNRDSSSVFIVMLPAGDDPEDIAEGGDDVTKYFIMGPPGH